MRCVIGDHVNVHDKIFGGQKAGHGSRSEWYMAVHCVDVGNENFTCKRMSENSWREGVVAAKTSEINV